MSVNAPEDFDRNRDRHRIWHGGKLNTSPHVRPHFGILSSEYYVLWLEYSQSLFWLVDRAPDITGDDIDSVNSIEDAVFWRKGKKDREPIERLTPAEHLTTNFLRNRIRAALHLMCDSRGKYGRMAKAERVEELSDHILSMNNDLKEYAHEMDCDFEKTLKLETLPLYINFQRVFQSFEILRVCYRIGKLSLEVEPDTQKKIEARTPPSEWLASRANNLRTYIESRVSSLVKSTVKRWEPKLLPLKEPGNLMREVLGAPPSTTGEGYVPKMNGSVGEGHVFESEEEGEEMIGKCIYWLVGEGPANEILTQLAEESYAGIEAIKKLKDVPLE